MEAACCSTASTSALAAWGRAARPRSRCSSGTPRLHLGATPRLGRAGCDPERAWAAACAPSPSCRPAARCVRAQAGAGAAGASSSDAAAAGTPLPTASKFVGLGETEFVAETLLPTTSGKYRVRAYRHRSRGTGGVTEPLAIIYGAVEDGAGVPIRVHDACFTSEVLGSMKCDCAGQLNVALDYIREKGPGLVVYLHQEGRGIGLANKIAAYKLQEGGLDTVDANRALGLPDDTREYEAVANILKDLRIESVRVLTNNPRKLDELASLGVRVLGRIACRVLIPFEASMNYLKTKRERMAHLNPLGDLTAAATRAEQLGELDGSWCYVDHDEASLGAIVAGTAGVGPAGGEGSGF